MKYQRLPQLNLLGKQRERANNPLRLGLCFGARLYFPVLGKQIMAKGFQNQEGKIGEAQKYFILLTPSSTAFEDARQAPEHGTCFREPQNGGRTEVDEAIGD